MNNLLSLSGGQPTGGGAKVMLTAQAWLGVEPPKPHRVGDQTYEQVWQMAPSIDELSDPFKCVWTTTYDHQGSLIRFPEDPMPLILEAEEVRIEDADYPPVLAVPVTKHYPLRVLWAPAGWAIQPVPVQCYMEIHPENLDEFATYLNANLTLDLKEPNAKVRLEAIFRHQVAFLDLPRGQGPSTENGASTASGDSPETPPEDTSTS